MKKILRHFIIDTVALYLVSQTVTGLHFAKGIETIFLAGAALAATTMLIRPIINILLLPLNLITFGLFKWIGHAVSLYIVTLVITDFKISEFIFNGYSNYWISVPAIDFSGILAFIAFSFLISFLSSIIYGLFG